MHRIEENLGPYAVDSITGEAGACGSFRPVHHRVVGPNVDRRQAHDEPEDKKSAMSPQTGTSGGFLVPTEFLARLLAVFRTPSFAADPVRSGRRPADR